MKRKLILCSDCLRRLGNATNAQRSGTPGSCELCKGIMSSVSSLADEAVRKLSGYQFQTFLVGTVVPSAILDREDEIRSKFKIRGTESIKAQVARTISKRISNEKGKTIDYALPDVTILVSLIESSVEIFSRSIWLLTKYTKTQRGISQRSLTCEICNGLGCAKCDYSGKAGRSIQSLVEKHLKNLLRAGGCNFLWVGSEDQQSLVSGNGRPFFVEVLHPKKRKLSSRERAGKKFDGVAISSLTILHKKPTSIPKLRASYRAYFVRDGESALPTDNLQSLLKEMTNNFSERKVQVRLSRKPKVTAKLVHSVKVVPSPDGNHGLMLDIDCDAGIPVKRFADGEGDVVSPNLCEYLKGFKLDTSQAFDVLGLREETVPEGVLN